MHMENGRKYYRAQAATRRIISKEFLKKYGITWNGDQNPTCELVGQMIENNDNVGWLSNDFLKEKQRRLCSTKNEKNSRD